MAESVILVDEQGRAIGVGEKMATHVDGDLHRAFSVFVFNSEGQMLLQQRAEDKYHSGGQWSNTCCSHPRPGEGTAEAVHRRLQEEMGFDTEVEEAFRFTYRAELDNDLSEHEYDHVFVGRFDGNPEPDPGEVAAWHWVDVDEMIRDMREHPDRYTYWFRLVVERVVAWYESRGP